MALANTAKRLIEKHGRVVQFYKINSRITQVDKPWRGSSDGQQSNLDFTTEVSASAVFLDPASLTDFGYDQMNEEARKSIASVALTHAIEQDIEGYDVLVDGEDKYKINKIMKLKPGLTTFLYAVELAR
jgi:hypothetical protein